MSEPKTPKLTVAQKRERDFMTLLDGQLAEQKKAHEIELAEAATASYTLGVKHGEQNAAHEFSRLSFSQKLRYGK